MFPFENYWAELEYDEYGAAVDPAEFDMSEPKAGERSGRPCLQGRKGEGRGSAAVRGNVVGWFCLALRPDNCLAVFLAFSQKAGSGVVQIP